MPRKSQGNEKMMRVLINQKDYQALETLARHQNTTVSEIVRRQIKAALDKAFQAVA